MNPSTIMTIFTHKKKKRATENVLPDWPNHGVDQPNHLMRLQMKDKDLKVH